MSYLSFLCASFFLIPPCRHGDVWPSLPGEGQEKQELFCPEADEDPRRDPTEAGAARPQREGGAIGGQPPFPHTTVSTNPSTFNLIEYSLFSLRCPQQNEINRSLILEESP